MRKGLLFLFVIVIVVLLANPLNIRDALAGKMRGEEMSTSQIGNEEEMPVSIVRSEKELTSLLLLVNKQNALPKDYKPKDLKEADVEFSFEGPNEEKMMRKEAASALEEMFQAAKDDNIRLIATSGYRSYKNQEKICKSYVKKHGKEYASLYCAESGKSEHHTGLAMDVGSTSGSISKGNDFSATREGKWIAEHAAEHGFIIRYLEGKEDITGYAYEPWHLRYVGKKTAVKIMRNGYTLEEYLAKTS